MSPPPQSIPKPPVALLRDPAFITLWLVGGMNSTGRWLEMLVIAVFVLEATGSPLWVASMLMLRLLPMAIFGVLGGVLANRWQRYKILRYASACVFSCASVLWWLADSGTLTVWHVGLASFISGLIWSTDFPVRRTLMSDIAGPARVGRAMSLDILAGASTRVIGPVLGGVLYQQIGLNGAFALTAGLYLVGFLALTLTNKLPIDEPRKYESVIGTIRGGFQALKQSPVLPGILAVTVVFNLWGFPFISLVPVFGKDVLGLTDALTGLLVSAEGLGALLGALLLSLFAQSRHSRYLYVSAVFAYCLFALAFAVSSNVWLSAFALLAVGFVSAAFGSMQSALVLMNSPPGQERQMMGVLAIAIGTAPLGFLHIGLLADWLSTPQAVTVVAIEGLLALSFTVWKWPSIMSLQPLQEVAD